MHNKSQITIERCEKCNNGIQNIANWSPTEIGTWGRGVDKDGFVWHKASACVCECHKNKNG
jgi:hypothetical protein